MVRVYNSNFKTIIFFKYIFYKNSDQSKLASNTTAHTDLHAVTAVRSQIRIHMCLYLLWIIVPQLRH